MGRDVVLLIPCLCIDKNVKVAVRGTFCYVFESTSHMPRNIVICMLKYLIEPVSGTIIYPLCRSRVYFCRDVRVQSGQIL